MVSSSVSLITAEQPLPLQAPKKFDLVSPKCQSTTLSYSTSDDLFLISADMAELADAHGSAFAMIVKKYRSHDYVRPFFIFNVCSTTKNRINIAFRSQAQTYARYYHNESCYKQDSLLFNFLLYLCLY